MRDISVYYLRQGRLCFCRCLSVSFSVCLLATLCKNFQTHLREIFREGWQWADEQMIKFWWRSGSQSGYRDCFPDSSLLGDTESGINRLCCATRQCRACTSRIAVATLTSLRHRPLAEVCTAPVLLVCSDGDS